MTPSGSVWRSLRDEHDVCLPKDTPASASPGSPTGARAEAFRKLADVDAELAYLALLTVRGIKPLSRWEKTLPQDAAARLGSLGLRVQSISRRVERGPIAEAVFSRSADLVGCYRSRFQDEPVRRTHDVVRVEGFLFGYPGCCVEAFLREPYRPNGLAQHDQRILFHWACPGCSVTPLLLPHYRWAHAIIDELCPGFGPVSPSGSPHQ